MRRSLVLFTLFSTLAVFAQGASSTPTGGASNPLPQSVKSDDDTLRQQTKQEFGHDQGLRNVTVTVDHGIALLRGEVDSTSARVRASGRAAKINGTVGVKNEIHVVGSNPQPGVTPSAAAQNATDEMKARSNAAPTTTSAGNPAPSAAGSIAGNTKQHAGALQMGSPQTASSAAMPNGEALTTGAATARVAGRESVMPQNDQSTAASSNATLGDEIRKALKNESMLSSSNVIIGVSDESIELSGQVATSKEKLMAERIAQSFGGNRRVVSRILIGQGPQPAPR